MADRTEYLYNKWKHQNVQDVMYKKGVFQGDYLSVILFTLTLNPLSILLNETDGYKIAINTIYEKILTHLFFADDLRLYAATLHQSELQLDIVLCSLVISEWRSVKINVSMYA